MSETLKMLLAAALAFTIGTECAALKYARNERDVASVALSYEHRIADLRVQAECAYHEGYNEGWRGASQEPVNGLIIRKNRDGSEEIVPAKLKR